MKKILLGIILLFPLQTIAADSVYNWGSWKDGIKPAAGPGVVAMVVAPAPVTNPNINIRPNETAELKRINSEAQHLAQLAEIERQTEAQTTSITEQVAPDAVIADGVISITSTSTIDTGAAPSL